MARFGGSLSGPPTPWDEVGVPGRPPGGGDPNMDYRRDGTRWIPIPKKTAPKPSEPSGPSAPPPGPPPPVPPPGAGGGEPLQTAPPQAPMMGLQAAGGESGGPGFIQGGPGSLNPNLGRRLLPNEVSALRSLTY